jgi:hypothetical protein
MCALALAVWINRCLQDLHINIYNYSDLKELGVSERQRGVSESNRWKGEKTFD